MVEDITGIEALRESKDNYRLVVEKSRQVIIVAQDGMIRFANASAEEATGYPRSQLYKMPFIEFIHPDDRTLVAENHQKRLRGEKTSPRYEFRVVDKDRQIRWIEMSVVKTEWNGRPATLNFLNDITKHKQAKEALKASEAKYRQLVEDAPAGIYEADIINQRFLSVNEVLCQFTGYSREELLGMSLNQVLTEAGRQILAERTRKVARGEEVPDTVEYPIRTKDGRELWVLVNTRLIRESDQPVRARVIVYDITERKKADEELRRSREALRAIYMGIPVPTYTWQRKGDDFRLIDFNDATIAYTKGAIKPFRGASAKEQYADFPEILEDFERCSQERKVIHREMTRFLKTVGEERSLVVTYAFVPPDLVLVHTEDVTERQDAEQALRSSEEHHRRLLEISPMAILTSHEGRIEYVNPAAVKLYRASGPEEMIGRRYLDLVHPDDRVESERRIGKVLKEGWSARLRQHRCLTLDGQVIEVESTGTTFDHEGRIMIQMVVQDITERKRAEEAVRQSGEKYRAIFEQSRDPIYFTTAEGEIIDINPAGQELFGYSREELCRLNVNSHYVDPQECERVKAEIESRGFIKDREVILRRKDGAEIVCLDTATVWRDQAGSIIGNIGTLRDVTAARQFEAERARLQEELRQAQKMEAIGTLAGGIAHDFNNILAAITGYTELALSDLPEDHPSKQSLQQVFKASLRAKDLVRQILSFARQAKPEPKPVLIGSIVKEVLKFLRASLPVTIEIRHDLGSQSGVILADMTEIHQLLMNLCTNAAQAMGEKGGLLRVRLDRVDLDEEAARRFAELSPGKYQKLTISDTGPGIDPAIMDRIFEPFFTTKGPGIGTGMGLAVAHGIVKNHSGAITVSSQLGKGSTFEVYLPLIEYREETGEIEEPGPVIGGNERILLVDDEEILADLGRQELEWLGYRVTAMTSSPEALHLFQARPNDFDLVLTDQIMPSMTGADLAQEMLKIRPDLPIILCTGFSEHISVEKALAMGIRRFVMKPLVISQAARIIRSVLDEKRKEEENPSFAHSGKHQL